MHGELVQARKRPRIVLLEDEPALSRLFEDCLHEWFEKLELLKFENGDEAWQELSREEPDLLMLDCEHPGLTGHQILELLIKAHSRFAILLTSDLFDQHLKLYSAQGLKFAFLPKPFTFLEFWGALNELVGPSDHAEIQALVKNTG